MDFGVIGYGYWGPNIVRNLMSLEGASVRMIADIGLGRKLAHGRLIPE